MSNNISLPWQTTLYIKGSGTKRRGSWEQVLEQAWQPPARQLSVSHVGSHKLHVTPETVPQHATPSAFLLRCHPSQPTGLHCDQGRGQD